MKYCKTILNILIINGLMLLTSLGPANGKENYDDLVKIAIDDIQIDGQTYLAISFKNKEKWHTYWKNPGSAGKPIEVEIIGLKTNELEWPAPKLYHEAGGLIAYGYSLDYTFFHKVDQILSSAKKVDFKMNWLICKDICIPGKKEFSLNIENARLNYHREFKVSSETIRKRFEALPKESSWPKDLKIKLIAGERPNTLILDYETTNKKSLSKGHNLLTPFPVPLITFNPEIISKEDNSLKGQLPLEWDGEYEDPEIPLPKNGLFEKPIKFNFIYHGPVTKHALKLEKVFSSFQLNKMAGENNNTLTKSKSSVSQIAPPASSLSQSLLVYLFFAFLGGLILNIMPCVLPVISLKLFNLASHSDESPKMILKHNIVYTLGVLSTFLVLAIIILAIKASGESVGWGFQLQNPYFVTIMVLFLFTLGLNLFGLFEFQTPGGKTLGNVELKKGFLGDFSGGVLATILSTPCSAPLLGPALTFAFTSSWPTVIAIFLTIGLGLSFPFLMTGFFPSTIRFLPRPGMWMDHAKKFLAVTMMLTVVWLLDVLYSLTDRFQVMSQLHLIFLLLFFAIYFSKNISKKVFSKIIAFSFPLLLLLNLLSSPNLNIEQSNTKSNPQVIKKMGLSWHKWSKDKMEEFKDKEQFVFMDFTADWCLTCKVNEKLVLDTEKFKNLIAQKDVALMLGDWTKKDAKIEAFLKNHGHVGVPAYFIQKKDGSIIKLGETISIKEIRDQLN